MKTRVFWALNVFALLFVIGLSAISFQLNAACNDDPNVPNTAWCIPAPGGQTCETQPGSCNCTCNKPQL